MNSFWLLEDYIFANDFLWFFDRSFQKNVGSQVFLKSEKNVKYVFSNTVCNHTSSETHARHSLRVAMTISSFFSLHYSLLAMLPCQASFAVFGTSECVVCVSTVCQSNWPGFLVRSGVLDDVETIGVNSASSGSSPVILILHDVNTS